MESTIRPAIKDDLPIVVEITKKAYSVWLPILGYPPLPVTEDYGPRIERGEVWLSCANDKPIALIVVERMTDHDMIYSVAVAPDYSGQGLGQQLVAFAEQRARDAGLAEIRLYTNALMESNIALYQRLGFRETERRPNPSRPGFVVVYMAKAL